VGKTAEELEKEGSSKGVLCGASVSLITQIRRVDKEKKETGGGKDSEGRMDPGRKVRIKAA